MVKALSLLVLLLLSHHRVKVLQEKHPDLEPRFLIRNFLLVNYSHQEQEAIFAEMEASERLLCLGRLNGYSLYGVCDPRAAMPLSAVTLRFLKELLEDEEAGAAFAQIKSDLELQDLDLEGLKQEVTLAEIIARRDPYIRAVLF